MSYIWKVEHVLLHHETRWPAWCFNQHMSVLPVYISRVSFLNVLMLRMYWSGCFEGITMYGHFIRIYLIHQFNHGLMFRIIIIMYCFSIIVRQTRDSSEMTYSLHLQVNFLVQVVRWRCLLPGRNCSIYDNTRWYFSVLCLNFYLLIDDYHGITTQWGKIQQWSSLLALTRTEESTKLGNISQLSYIKI